MSTEKNFLVDLWLISFLANRMASEILGDTPLSVDEFAMYGLISDLAPITSADLVRATGLPPTTVSSIVRRCETRGELVRVDNPDDRRSSFLELTPVGYSVLSSVVPKLLEVIQRVENILGGRQTAFRECLEELDGAIRIELGVGPRPYSISRSTAAASVPYPGERLTSEQSREVLQFIEWLRVRDG